MSGALVLAGGGTVGIAWELGIIRGLEIAAPELIQSIREPETTYVGTSAGSIVSTMLATGASVESLLQPEFDSATAPAADRQGSLLDIAKVAVAMSRARMGHKTPEAGRQQIGAFAAKSQKAPESTWVESIRRRITDDSWPERRLLITAVDINSGEFRVFDRDSGVDLAAAVAASCSVPGVFPPVTIEGHRYMDGGMRSIANSDLAAGCDPILILVPNRAGGPGIGSLPPDELDALKNSRTKIVYADRESVRAFGRNPLSTTTRAAAANAGIRQGQELAAELAQFWNA